MLTRRNLLKAGALGAAGLAMPVGWLANAAPVAAFTHSAQLRKFVQPLRRVGAPGGIPFAVPDKVNPGWWQKGATHYTIDIAQFHDQLHPDLPNPTRLWGFGQAGHFRHLGAVIHSRSGTPVQVTFRNHLPAHHILPVDRTLMGAAKAQNRTSVHLHGAFVPWISDGNPFAWWDPAGQKGASFAGNHVLRPGQAVPANEAEFFYPNDQTARLLWYHDHAVGITRLNVMAGLVSAFIITDDQEAGLSASGHLPGPLAPRTHYLIFQDKIFVQPDINRSDPRWHLLVRNSRAGDLWYPHVYSPDDLAPGGRAPVTSEVPEFFGDTILVNGTAFPFVEVERRQYRIRMLNACNSRFLRPRLVFAKGPGFPASTEPSNNPGPAFLQIGNEGGFLPQPTMVNARGVPKLLLAPAERADLIVDFRDVPAGSRLILFSDSAAPFPVGDAATDFFPGNPATPRSIPGHGPNTRTLLQFRVKARVGPADPPITLPATIRRPQQPFLVHQVPGVPTPPPAGVHIRQLTLNEVFDDFGRLIQFLGTNEATPAGFGRAFDDRPTEIIPAGTTEMWTIANLTGDSHPIHFHLVNVQILSRQAFDAVGYDGGSPTFVEPAIAPDPNELGWKETVRINPSEVIRVLVRFDLPASPFTVPVSPRLRKSYGINGAEYVWHCHILEHEEHDMMRPIVVV